MTPLSGRARLPPELSSIAESLVCEARREEKAKSGAVFIPRALPRITIHDYILRMYCYGTNEEAIYTVAKIYLIRAVRNGETITPWTVHRMYLIATVIASKFLNDSSQSNSTFAKIGGIPVGELNTLEVKFLTAIGFDLWVTPEEYEEHLPGTTFFR